MMAKSKAQKAMAAGPSKIGAKARAAARTVVRTRSDIKARETDHLRPDQFAGRHHAPSSMTSVRKNNAGGESTGRHAVGNAGGYVGKHRAAAHDHWKDIAGVVKSGGYSYGKHSTGT